jgi:uncharacterized protein YprB with RNaseH-like and TPR domain
VVPPVVRTSWIEHPLVLDPPGWTEIETTHGIVERRRLRIPFPEELRVRFPASAIGEPPDVPALFFDTETLGLGSQPIILMGMAGVAGDGVWLEQLYARDYSREGALLARARERLEAAALLVSYNGRSYDVPMIRDRLVRHRLEIPGPRPHVDLLHRARRQYKGILPDCRLTTLEFRLMGRNRQGDVKGADIPRLYHHCVRTNDPTWLGPVFHHNALDLFCLIELVLHLDAGLSP